jgi:hypothetical protein
MRASLAVDDTVSCDAPTAPVASDLGFVAHPLQVGSRVVFAAAAEVPDNHSAYDRVLREDNGRDLRLVGHGEVFPLASGLGFGLGLEHDVATFAVRFDEEVSAVRIFPSGVFGVYTAAAEVNGSLQMLGDTAPDSGSDSASLSFAASPSRAIVLKHAGAFDVTRVLFYTQSAAFETRVVPLFDNAFPAPFLVASGLDLTRRGGLYTGNVRAMNVVVEAPVALAAQVSTGLHATSIERDYVEQSVLNRTMVELCNEVFPALSRLERAVLAQYDSVVRSIEAMNSFALAIRTIPFDTSIVTEPTTINLVEGCTYAFSSPVVLGGTAITSLTPAAGYVDVIEIEGKVCTLIAVASAVVPVQHELPPSIFVGIPLSAVTEASRAHSESMPTFSRVTTPNAGNPTSHVTFVDANGVELSAERALFLAGDVATVSVVTTGATECAVYVDDVLVRSVAVPEASRFALATVKLPTLPGVHTIRTDDSSNVMFRISGLSVVHAPTHPRYYASGQLEGDTRASSTITLTLEHPNMDIVPSDARVTLSSPANFVQINDVQFDTSASTTLAALFCRSDVVDLKGGAAVIDDASAHTFCDDMPWLSCYDMREGGVRLSCLHSLRHFTLWWYPEDASRDCTLIDGVDSCLRMRGGDLQLQMDGEWLQVDDVASYVHSRWHQLACNDGVVYLDGVRADSHPVSVVKSSPSTLFVGTRARVALSPALEGGSVNLGDTADASECILRVLSPVSISQVTLLAANGAVAFARSAEGAPLQEFHASGALPQQVIGIETVPEGAAVHDVQLVFNPAGHFRCLMMYGERMTDSHITSAFLNMDSAISFSHAQVAVQATGDELDATVCEIYDQVATTDAPNASWLAPTSTSSLFVSPPSLVLLRTSQSTPYGLGQSVILIFNRRVEVFTRDESTLFTLAGGGKSHPIRADLCTLLTFQITISNAGLGTLQPGTSYAIELEEGRLRQFSGSVPCLAGSVSFTTE